MAETTLAQKRANPRFSFIADAEITLKDRTLVPFSAETGSANLARLCHIVTTKRAQVGGSGVKCRR